MKGIDMKKISKIFPALLLAALTLTSCSAPVATGEVQKHNVLHWEIVTEVGCESEGYRFGLCVDCKNEVRDVMEPLGHDFREGFCVRCKKEAASNGENEALASVFEFSDNGRGYTLVKCNEYAEKILNIPSEYDGKPVTEISENAFMDNKYIEELIVPDSVKYIGARAFKNCTALEKAYIGKSVTELSEEVFYGCISLREAVLPDSLVTINTGCFRGCVSLESASARFCREIGDGAFMNCEMLHKFVFPDTLERIGRDAFAYSGITSAELPDSVRYIFDDAFAASLVRTATIPKNLQNRCNSMFRECKMLESVTVESVLIFTEFEGCDNLKSIVFTEGISEVFADTLGSCGAETIYLPRSVTFVGEKFLLARSVRRIVYAGESKEFFNISGLSSFLHLNWGSVIECTDKTLTIQDVMERIESQKQN